MPGKPRAANCSAWPISHKLRIYAQVPEAYAAADHAGLKAELHFAEHPGKAYDAEAVRTSNALDPTARTLQVELQLDNADGEFSPGRLRRSSLQAARRARRPCGCRPTPFCSAPTGCRSPRSTATTRSSSRTSMQGRDFGKTIEVLDGLDPNDRVVVNPPDSIDDGMHVRIAPGNDKKPAS